MSVPRRLFALLLVALTGGCITFRTVDDGIARARIGETVRSGPVTVRPDRVLEDSRCPAGVQCIRAGALRLAVTIDGQPAELTLGAGPGAGGALALVEAYPPPRDGVTRYPDEYRFGFRQEPPARR